MRQVRYGCVASFHWACMSMTVRIMLSPKLDVEASNALAEALLEERGANVVLDASEVRHLGAHAIQVLVTAAHGWMRDGKSLKLENLPDEQSVLLTSIGLPPSHFMTMENAG